MKLLFSTLSLTFFVVSIIFGQEASKTIDSLKNVCGSLKRQLSDGKIEALFIELSKTHAITASNFESYGLKIQNIAESLEQNRNLFLYAQKHYAIVKQEIANLIVNSDSTNPKFLEGNQIGIYDEATDPELIKSHSNKLKSYVTAWNTMGSQISAASQTMENVLIFPEDGQKINSWIKIGQYAGIVGGIVGTILASKNQTAGITTSGASLSLSAILSTVGKNDKLKSYIQNLSRNAAFTDEIKSYNKVAQAFASGATSLFNSIGQAALLDDNWKPNKVQVASFYSLLSISRDFNTVTRQMKAKAETLISIGNLNKVGEEKLEIQKSLYDNSLKIWESSEAIYLLTYNTLINAQLN